MAEGPLDDTNDPGGIGALPSQDQRPNSGLREGDVTHTDVNEALRLAPKTVIFGQQTRLRLGLLMEDDSLPRFHAGHDLVKFFYGAIRQIPDVILDGMLAAGISVTMVRQRELLFFRNVREHQSFHTGRTRLTIYIPEKVVEAAFKRGYDYWALSEVIIKEAFPLLDYILILELVRHVQVKMRQVLLPGISFIKDTLRSQNRHLKDPTERLRAEGRAMMDPKEDEFGEFWGHYGGYFKAWGREILERDPYDVADEVYDESTERKWAEWKVDHITHTFSFPTLFELDRDIVHPAAYEQAEKVGQKTAPVTVDEVLHDLADLARFRVSRQIKTEPLLDQLINYGAPGILGFATLVARERALGEKVVTEYLFDGYDPVVRFRQKLQDFSQDLPPDLGVGGTFDRLVMPLVVATARERFEHYRSLSDLDGGDWRHFLRQFVFELIGATKPYMADAEKELMLTTPVHFSPNQQTAAWLAVAETLLPDDDGIGQNATLVEILRELRRHPEYHGLFEEQARALQADVDFGDDQRGQVATLMAMIPDPPHKFTSEPHAVRRRVDDLRRLHSDDPDSEDQYRLLGEIFIRLDLADNYAELVELVRGFGAIVRPSLEEIVDVISDRDTRRALIRQVAVLLLKE